MNFELANAGQVPPGRHFRRPHPRPLSKGEGSRDTMFGVSLPSPLERGRG
ncbi:MAG: hypothetical protein LBB79_09345 [Prevotellaceae bacterium]|nr:hypothetical protein [Prevotellaceae bacterium]